MQRRLPIFCDFLLRFRSSHTIKSWYKGVIFTLTMIVYAMYHMNRKIISVVKPALHQNCTDSQKKMNMTNCSWAPFDGDNWATLMGNLDLAFLLCYSASTFFCGFIAERTNIRYFLSGSLVLMGLTTSLFGFGYLLDIHSFSYYLMAQMIAGLFQATGWSCVVTCMGNWFNKSRRGLLMGLWNSQTGIGNILGALIPGIFLNNNWSLSFIIPGIMCAILSIPVFLVLLPYPGDLDRFKAATDKSQLSVEEETVPLLADDHEFFDSCGGKIATSFKQDSQISVTEYEAETAMKDKSSSDSSSDCETSKSRCSEVKVTMDDESTQLLSEVQNKTPISFLGALRIPGVLSFCGSFFFVKLVMYSLLFWLPTYIRDRARLQAAATAAMFSTLMDVGGIVGGVVAGLVSDHIRSQALTCCVMLLLGVPFMYVFYAYGTTSFGVLIVMLLVLGFLITGPYSLISTAVCADLGTHESLRGNSEAIATVTAIINGTGSLGAAIGPLLTGLLMPYGWGMVFAMLMSSSLFASVLLSPSTFSEIKAISWRRSNI